MLTPTFCGCAAAAFRRHLLAKEEEALVEAAIFGGHKAPADRYKWMAQLVGPFVDQNEDDGSYFLTNKTGLQCGASLVHPRVLLTAGHW